MTKGVQAVKKQTKEIPTAADNEESKNGVVYLSRLPYGFDDRAAREFFGQFGEVKGVCFPRSKKTARSKGYMFLLFEDRDVAAIAAKTMDKYFVAGKTIHCELLPESSRILHDRFKKDTARFKFVPWQKIFAKQFDSGKTDEKRARKLQRLVENDDKKVERFRKQGINFDFPTYKSLLDN